ncbi:unnamed protein product [Clavelina lepadiformis]|uniref:EGF-like domain-containing protein n=1 Tax=Clavelina lepadiformis TaxID=159417 RepID=A0ABP0GS17_CLALP
MGISNCILVLSLLLLGIINSISCEKTPCEGCKDLALGILKGLDQSKNKNFGGGDTAWEEKRDLKFRTSETRLVEILETACTKDNYQCNKILEEREDDIEKWYKDLQDKEALQDYLCVKTAKVCCPENTFGEDCEECPKGDSDSICFGRGKCEGAGDKQGSGKCICEAGYAGDLCNECDERYFKSFSNDTYVMCTLCHETCQTCTGGNATECETCRTGYREEHDTDDEKAFKCVDMNECVEQRDLCPVGQYCTNTVGSYKCEDCSESCTSCFGPSRRHCYNCTSGSIMRIPYMCQDIDECASGAICLGMYEVCVNTPGHYKCECARFFRRDPVSGQCQPDPAIYSRYVPERPGKKTEKKSEDGEQCYGDECHDRKDHGASRHSVAGSSDDGDSLSDNEIKKLIFAVVICLLGTAAAKGSMFWTLMFFLSFFSAGLWWASDKTDKIYESFSHPHFKQHQEL